MKFLCEQCKAKYQIADEKAVGKTVRMKCRKCGHLIEVRAAVTETSVSSLPAERPVAAPPTAAPVLAASAPGSAIISGPAESEPPASATMIAIAPVAPSPARPAPRPASALEGAFKTSVQSSQHEAHPAPAPARPAREDEPSTPFDMADLSSSDEWYVAINGVPVGPIRVAEVRRKAALGAVTEDSLVWQEGLDEWRPLRTFPELAASVREASTRLSRPPPGEARLSAPPPPPARSSFRSTGAPLPPPAARAVPPPRSSLGPSSAAIAPPAPQTAAAARSNVVPIMSRLATAEKLEPVLAQRTSPVPGPPAPPPPAAEAGCVIVPDPFAGGPAAASISIPAAAVMAVAPSGAISSMPPSAKPVSWMGRAFVVMACAFGITAALAMVDQILLKRPPPTVSDTTNPSSIAPAPGVPSAAPTAAPTATEAVERPTPAPTTASTHAPTVRPTPAAATAAATATATAAATGTGRSLDLHSLTQSGSISPTEEPGSDTPKPAGGGNLTEAQVSQVVGLHRPGVSRGCWDRNPTAKPAVNVTVSLTVAPDGSAQNVSAAGDDASVAKCIENDVRNWKFPASGASQKIAIPFKFVRQ